MENRHTESGNVLFYILIAVSLIAALSYAVSQSSRGGGSGINDERARLLAGEILEYGNVLANAVAQLRLHGCLETQLRFDGNDDECDVLHVNGGGVSLAAVPPQVSANGYVFSAAMDVVGIGTTASDATSTDLSTYIVAVNQNVCAQINAMSGITTPETPAIQNGYSVNAFTGAFTYVDTLGDQAGTTRLNGAKSGCFQSPNATGDFVFYRVLMAR